MPIFDRWFSGTLHDFPQNGLSPVRGDENTLPAYALYGLMGTFPPSDGTVLRISYTKAEAAYALGTSVRTIDNLIKAKELRSRRARGRILIPANALQALVRSDHKTLRAAA